MDIHANAFGINMDHPMDEVDKVAKKGEQWFKDETVNLESLVSRGDEDAKQKLMQLAEKYKVPVNGQMNMAEIKNKIKAKLREMR